MDRNEQLMIATHLGDEYGKYLNAVVPPVFMNTLHVFPTMEDYFGVDVTKEDNFIYGRCSNPTAHLLERKIAALEHGALGAVFSSGMAAATSAIFAVCGAGDHVLCMRDVYQPIKRFMATVGARLNIDISFVTGLDLDEVERAIRPNTKLMILESPATFVFTVADIAGICEICKRHGVRTYIDNTCATPLYQNPLDMGVDLVMHTLSKYMGGHSDVIGGALASKDEQLMRVVLDQTREWFGGILGPMEAWLVIRGLRTLDARLIQHQATAMKVAAYLEGHPKVARVYYTGLPSHPQAALIAKQMRGHTGLMSLSLKDNSPEKAIAFVDHLKLFGKGCSWGGFESLAICPLVKAEEEEMRFLDLRDRGLIRLHCGLEGADNLLNDLEQALAKI